MAKLKFSFVILLILLSVNVRAGWYICYNYTGNIGKLPINLSLQINALSPVSDKYYPVECVYLFLENSSPIKLRGTVYKGKYVSLTEYDERGNGSAEINFELCETTCTGSWRNLKNNSTTNISLKFTNYATDCDIEDISALPFLKNSNFPIEITQYDSWKEFYFVGLYSKTKNEDRVQMDKLIIRRKEDNQNVQEINLSKLDYKVGNLKTVIYENVEVFINDEILLWCDAGRIGGYYKLSYDKKTKKFTLNSKVTLEGGDPGD